MNLKENPFYVLNLSTLAGKAEILDRVEELVFDEDEEKLQTASHDLLNSRERMDWEIRWFPYLSKLYSEKVANILREGDIPSFTIKDGALFCTSKKQNFAIEWGIQSDESTLAIRNAAAKFAIINSSIFELENSSCLNKKRAELVNRIVARLSQFEIGSIYDFINYARKNYSKLPDVSREDVLSAFKEYANEVISRVAKVIGNAILDPFFAELFITGSYEYRYGDFADIYAGAIDSTVKRIEQYVISMMEIVKKWQNATNLNTTELTRNIKELMVAFKEYAITAVWFINYSQATKQEYELVIALCRSFAISISNNYGRHKESQAIIELLVDKCPKDYSQTAEKLTQDLKTITGIVAQESLSDFSVNLHNDMSVHECEVAKQWASKCESEEKNGCYIATCVYGSYDCSEVWILRRFRDFFLRKSFLGRLFIRFYYFVSPKIVELFGEKSLFKRINKGILDRFVQDLKSKGYEDSPYDDSGAE